MKLPASFVRTWNDLQLNFDALAKQSDGYTFAQTFGGGWPTTVPAPTVGIAFTVPKTGPALISTTASAYISVAGNSISIDVYLDGALTANMAMNASIPTATHMMATPGKIARNLTRGTHYVAYRQVSGTSDASDIGAVSVVQP